MRKNMKQKQVKNNYVELLSKKIDNLPFSIRPKHFEEFKKSADGYYNSVVCEYQTDCPREGYVYYKTTDPTFSFKNVSREYLARK